MRHATGRRLLLASGSRYRGELLRRLGVDFQAAPPEVDETPLPGEAPAALAMRLAQLKARTVHDRDPAAWVIGSDQVADCGGRILGKPGSPEEARRQLLAASGRTVDFHTGLSVAGPRGFERTHCDLTRVHFRSLDEPAVERYLQREPALDCAGSFKAEGLGITLFDAVESRDPTALVGLPLIALAAMLRQAGFELP